MLSFTSMEATIDYSVMVGHGAHTFHISGANYHQIGMTFHLKPMHRDLHNFIFMTYILNLAIESKLLRKEVI